MAVHGLPAGTFVVSGGARGVDQWAAESARSSIEYPVRVSAGGLSLNKAVWAAIYYARNEAVSTVADRCIAFVTKDTGGTWDTIRRFQEKGKRVLVIRPGGAE
jgi:predicted Rossmann fold nucleotide-binding protein DprA/Smf involved in DNA uptake